MSRQFDFSDTTLRALAYELKYPLVNIARQTELDDRTSLAVIQQTAEQALRLIDSYLMSAQAEYGQLMLELEPISLGSVLYDTSVQLREQALESGRELVIDDRVHDLVMTHRPALTTLMTIFGSTLLGFTNADKPKGRPKLVLRGFKTREQKLGIGVFSQGEIFESDLRQAFELQGRAHMPLARLNQSSHVSLAIANSLCGAIGGEMKVKRMGRLSGLVTELPRSEQLALV